MSVTDEVFQQFKGNPGSQMPSLRHNVIRDRNSPPETSTKGRPLGQEAAHLLICEELGWNIL